MHTHAPSTSRFAPVALAVLIATAGALFAGPLNPPAGPVTSTNKTLAEVEPRTAINLTNTPGDADSLFKITQPGSYYLTGNITGVVGKHGIEIAASGVTLDLNGFDLAGVAGMGAFDGVSTTVTPLVNIAVLNGSVRNWGDEGVDLLSLAASNSRVDNVRASGNAGNGIGIGSNSTVANCSAGSNLANGISTGSGCTVTNCTANVNAFNGFLVNVGCTVTNCVAIDNTSDGIDTDSACTVTDFVAVSNTGNGIDVLSGCKVTNCVVRLNTLNGIVCLNNCVLRNNACDANGAGTGDGAGIFVSGSDNRIEGNNCSDGDRGIDVNSAGNIIIKNTCAGNALNWDVLAGNVILVVPAATAGAVSGNAGGAAPGSTDPNANFTY